MSDEACLALRLEGPFQAWGTSSQYNRRLTGLLPSRSGIAGMLCAAMGLDRGSQEEQVFLTAFSALSMLAVAVPRQCGGRELEVRRMEDFHTVQNTLKAAGGLKDCHITHRQYLQDAAFMVFLTGSRETLEKAGAALRDPVWGIWLGRKACIPSAPVFAGLFDGESAAVAQCLPEPLDDCIYNRDACSFADGEDSLADIPLSFASAARRFSLRRVKTHQGMRHAP